MAFNAHSLKLKLMEGWEFGQSFEKKTGRYTATASRGGVNLKKTAATLDEAVAFVCMETMRAPVAEKKQD